MTLIVINIIAFALTLLGSVVWGIIGIFDWNLVAAIFGPGMNIGSTIVYILVFLSSLWLLISLLYSRGRLYFNPKDAKSGR